MLALTLSSSAARAQAALELPQPSPKARTEQRVGITDFALDYSSPGVKKRKIWGELVPYDKVWRAGANAATKLIASRDFTFGGTAVKAGTYSVFVTPSKTTWTVMLNTDVAATQETHDDKKNVAKITVTPQTITAPRERLLWLFNDTGDDRTSLELEWERIRIKIPLTTDTKGQVNAAIEKATGDVWRPPFLAANYLQDAGELDRALTLIDRSIQIQSTWRNEWLRAQILGKKGGKKDEALAAAKRAETLGKGDQVFEQFIKPNMAKTIAGWK